MNGRKKNAFLLFCTNKEPKFTLLMKITIYKFVSPLTEWFIQFIFFFITTVILVCISCFQIVNSSRATKHDSCQNISCDEEFFFPFFFTRKFRIFKCVWIQFVWSFFFLLFLLLKSKTFVFCMPILQYFFGIFMEIGTCILNAWLQ